VLLNKEADRTLSQSPLDILINKTERKISQVTVHVVHVFRDGYMYVFIYR